MNDLDRELEEDFRYGLLEEIPPEALENSATPSASTPSFSWRDADGDPWQDVLSEDVPQAIYEAVFKTLLIPRWNEQWRLICSYLALPSRFAHNSPICFSVGKPGSGKSQLARIVAAMLGLDMADSGSTTAGLKRLIMSSKFRNPGGGIVSSNEQDFFVLWEDLSTETLNDVDRFSFIKNGVNYRATFIKAGESVSDVSKFPIFAPKIVSSISPLWLIHDYRELQRRVLVVNHKPFQEWKSDDFCVETQGRHPNDLLEIEEIDFQGFKGEREMFWNLNHARFKEIRKSLSRAKTELSRPLFTMLLDILVTGIICGYYSDSKDAIQDAERYWNRHLATIESASDPLTAILKPFLANIESMGSQITRIQTNVIKTFVNDKAKNGELNVIPTPGIVYQKMTALGYSLKEESGSNYWVKVEV